MAGKTLLILIAFSLLPTLAEAQVTFGRSVQQEIHVSSEAGGTSATLSVSQAQTVLPGGRILYGSMIALFVPSSRLLWWMHQSSNGVSDPETAAKEFLDSFTFSVHPDQIACFSANGKVLEVRTSEMQVSNMDEGLLKARKLLSEELPSLLSGAMLSFQRVPLAQAVGQTFLLPKDFGDPPIRLKIGAVDRSASGWRIEIRNDRGESKTVILSRDFKAVTSASQ
jgi:hypothetical protein